MSKGRAWMIVTILVVALIVALGIGLGVGLGRKRDTEQTTVTVEVCPIESSARLNSSSPLYVPPTDTFEGKFSYLSVASVSSTCSEIGNRIMVNLGGSAVDAAIATIVCVGVVNPQSCGIGGGHFMTYYNRQEGKVYNIMAREMAPGAATTDMYLQEGTSSRNGGLAIGIPGEMMGLYEAWKLGGRLPWSDLLQPAIILARDGFSVDRALAKSIADQESFYSSYSELRSLVTNPETGELYQAGEVMKRPKLAATLQTIATEGAKAVYNGSLSADIVADIQDAGQAYIMAGTSTWWRGMNHLAFGGIITEEDLARFEAVIKDPLMFTLADGNKVYSPPPPSGGSVVLLLLNIIKDYGFSESSFSTVDDAVLTYHRIIEASKHAFSVRSRLGDADVESEEFKENMTQLVNQMLDPAFGRQKKAKIDDMRTFSTAYYEPAFYNPQDTGTSSLSVLAPNGDAVSITSTINMQFGSKVVGSRTGIVFNNEMDDFSTPGVVNSYGIVASPANYIKPYKRPLSSMSPTIVISPDGEVRLNTGAAGGPRIITSVSMTIMQTLMFKLGLKEAIDYPRLHHQLLPPEVWIDSRFPQVLIDGLKEKGHNFTSYELYVTPRSVIQGILQRTSETIYANCDPIKFARPYGC